MEDLIIEDKLRKTTFGVDGYFDNNNSLKISIADDFEAMMLWHYLTPSQTRELIEHLTNCLKEVENG